MSVISADLAPSLDLTLATVQQQVAVAIEAAKTEMSQGLPGLPFLWANILTIATDLRSGFNYSLHYSSQGQNHD